MAPRPRDGLAGTRRFLWSARRTSAAWSLGSPDGERARCMWSAAPGREPAAAALVAPTGPPPPGGRGSDQPGLARRRERRRPPPHLPARPRPQRGHPPRVLL